jgi:antitoxin ParD1/3/4
MIYRSIAANIQFVCLLRMTVMKLITLYLPETYIKALDQLVDECFYPNRAEAIRVAIRDLISAEVWRRKGVD